MAHRIRWGSLFFVGLLLATAGWHPGRSAIAEAPPPPPDPVSPASTHRVYLPLVFRAPRACDPIPGVSYIHLDVLSTDRYDPNKPPPDNNPDYRLSLLGYYPVNRARQLIPYDPSHADPRAPQFTTLFAGQPVPPIVNTYQACGWDWVRHQPICPAPWDHPNGWPPVSALGLQTAPETIVQVPDSGYVPGWDCGPGGCDALVLYASEWEITLRYAREDDLFPGYTIHIVGICVEPSLRALYRTLHAQGRERLPAVYGGQPIGRAWGNEIIIALRDNGPFMDPRDCHSFWRGYCP